jgi:hypothetical protein
MNERLTRSHVPCEVICSSKRTLAGGALEKTCLLCFGDWRLAVRRVRCRCLHTETRYRVLWWNDCIGAGKWRATRDKPACGEAYRKDLTGDAEANTVERASRKGNMPTAYKLSPLHEPPPAKTQHHAASIKMRGPCMELVVRIASLPFSSFDIKAATTLTSRQAH